MRTPDSSTAAYSVVGAPNGIRTRVAALKGRNPRPLDDGGPGVRAPPTRGQPRKYSARNLCTDPSGTSTRARATYHSRTAFGRADDLPMRALLEFLGIVEPDRSRREAIALPAAIRWLGLGLAIGLALASLAVYALVRAVLG
jgi:hypothetical protein